MTQTKMFSFIYFFLLIFSTEILRDCGFSVCSRRCPIPRCVCVVNEKNIFLKNKKECAVYRFRNKMFMCVGGIKNLFSRVRIMITQL